MKPIFHPIIGKKSQWELHVRFMHGDADHFEKHKFQFDTMEEVVDKIKILGTCPDRSHDDKYVKWCEEQESWLEVPREPPGYDYYSSVDGHEVFYWDDYGIKNRVEFE